MVSFKHILFPVDFSGSCDAIRPAVDFMVGHFDARLTLMHVIQFPMGLYGGIEYAFPVVFDPGAITAEALRALDTCFPPWSPFSKAEKFVAQGDPGTLIPLYAERNAVDLIMMPTHGYGKFRALLLGSVAAKVLHDATCSVWTAAHVDDSGCVYRSDYRSVLCPVNTSSASVELIRQADDIARSYNATLRLVHALSPSDGGPENHRSTECGQYALDLARERLVDLQKDAGTDVEVCIESGRVSSVVRRAALRHNADLVVIGRGKLQKPLGRLRTSAYAIIRESPCPVLSF